RDGYQAFKKAKDDLIRIVETEAPHAGLLVRSDGTVEARYSVARDAVARDPESPETFDLRRREAIAAMQRRINAVIDSCDDADEACSNALRADITGDRHNFSAPKYTS